MQTFSKLYSKARYTVVKRKWPTVRAGVRGNIATDWQRLLHIDYNLPLMMASETLDHNHAAAADNLRQHIDQEVLITGRSLGEVIADVNDMAKQENKSWSLFAFNIDRAASLKVLYHLYFVYERGAQGIWIYDPPCSNKCWPFSISKNRNLMVPQLNDVTEYYSANFRDLIKDASIDALGWCAAALGSLRQRKKYMIEDWFIGDDTRCNNTATINNYLITVSDALNKMIEVLNSNTLIYSYHPDFGKKEKDTLGFVYLYEKLDVIYLNVKPSLVPGQTPTELLIMTIIHEVSHRALYTEDYSYSFEGLKPNSSGFNSRKAINNADSWAYFVADTSNNLTDVCRDYAWRHKR